ARAGAGGCGGAERDGTIAEPGQPGLFRDRRAAVAAPRPPAGPGRRVDRRVRPRVGEGVPPTRPEPGVPGRVGRPAPPGRGGTLRDQRAAAAADNSRNNMVAVRTDPFRLGEDLMKA